MEPRLDTRLASQQQQLQQAIEGELPSKEGLKAIKQLKAGDLRTLDVAKLITSTVNKGSEVYKAFCEAARKSNALVINYDAALQEFANRLKAGDETGAKELIRAGLPLTQTSQNKNNSGNAFVIALRHGNLEFANEIYMRLTQGTKSDTVYAHVKKVGSKDMHKINQEALKIACLEPDDKVLKGLESLGIRLDTMVFDEKSNREMGLVEYAASVGNTAVLKMLLDKGMSKHGALDAAIKNGNIECALMLLDYPVLTASSALQLLLLAVEKNRSDLALSTLAACRNQGIELTDKEKEFPIALCVIKANRDLAQLLAEQQTTPIFENESLEMWACRAGHAKVVKELLAKAGQNVDALLMQASMFNHVPVVRVIFEHNPSEKGVQNAIEEMTRRQNDKMYLELENLKLRKR